MHDNGNSLARMHGKSSVIDTDADMQACNRPSSLCRARHQIVPVYSATQSLNVTAETIQADAFMS